MTRVCYRSIDRPQILFGLEIEDIALVVSCIGIGSLCVESLYPGVAGIVAWIVLAKFKQGKPFGYLLHKVYQHGVVFPGLLPLSRGITYFGVYCRE